MKIDRNVPLPAKTERGGYTTAKRGQSKYNFAKMKPGSSFIVPAGKRHSVSTLAKKFGENQSPVWKFIVRTDGDGKLRCWRVE